MPSLDGRRASQPSAGSVWSHATVRVAAPFDGATAAPPCPKSHAVGAFLKEIGLFQYTEPLLRSGFDDMETLLEIEDGHMKDLGIPPGHVLKLKKRLREFARSHGEDPQGAADDASTDFGASDLPHDMALPVPGPPTADMRALVRRSWEQIVASGSTVLGELLFRNLLRLHGDALKHFPFRGEGSIYDSDMFRKVSGELVVALHDMLTGSQVARPILAQIVVGPVSDGELRRLHESLGQALISIAKAGLRDAFTAEVEAAWRSVYAAAVAESSRLSAPSAPCFAGRAIDGGRETYRVEGHLQKAIFGDVWKAVGVPSGRRFAVKVVDLSTVDELKRSHDVQLCETPLCEVHYHDLMQGLEHVAQMEEHFGDESCHYVVSELATGGDLLEALKLRPGGLYERQAQDLVLQAVKGLCSLHERGLAMQDVSLENMLLYPRGDGEWQVRLCDPGQAAPLTFDEVTGAELPTEFHGYVAKQFRPPELYSKRPYMATKVDSWCLGWSTFYLLVAQPMFHSADPTVHDADWTLFQRRVFSKLFQQKGWRATLSHQAKDFILRLMQINPDLRMSLKQALRHPWLTEDVAQQHVFDRDESKQAFDADRPASVFEGHRHPHDPQLAADARSDDGEPAPPAISIDAAQAAPGASRNTPMGIFTGGGTPSLRAPRPSRSLSPGPVDAFHMNMQASDWCQPATQPPSPQDAPSPVNSEQRFLAPRQTSYKLTEAVKKALEEVEDTRRSRRVEAAGDNGDAAAGHARGAPAPTLDVFKLEALRAALAPAEREVGRPTLLSRRAANSAEDIGPRCDKASAPVPVIQHFPQPGSGMSYQASRVRTQR